MIKIKQIAIIIAFIVCHNTHAFSDSASSTSVMDFNGDPPSRENKLLFGGMWTIFADGLIDLGAGQRLQRYIDDNNIPNGSTIVLNSIGGSLIGGIELGKTIRTHSLNTHIGTKGNKIIIGGKCYSACAFAFIGGKFRYATKGSVYGVHRFHKFDNNANSDDAQIVSAALVQYIRDMGVDPALFEQMVLAGKNQINIIQEQDQEKLNIVNNGREKTVWELMNLPDGTVYLAGRRETWRGKELLVFSCMPDKDKKRKGMVFAAGVFGGKMADAIGTRASSIVINDIKYRLDKYDAIGEGARIENGMVWKEFSLPAEMLPLIMRAKTIGILFQTAYDAPSFAGFMDMDTEGGIEKLSNILRGCER
ncbi:MAG: hypothetical protein HQM01_13825 [Magnetococcales bacterium]|nr:hypothetical protein [Magnetococcales bacterium]